MLILGHNLHNCGLNSAQNMRSYMPVQVKARLNKGNACYHPVQNLLSSRSQSKNIKIRFVMIRVVLIDVKVCLAVGGKRSSRTRKREEYWDLK
jgi:hypothetical protein